MTGETERMCCKRLFRNWAEHPCKQKAKVERDGKPFCTIHDPERIKAKRAQQQARWDARTAIDRKRYALDAAAPRMLDALKKHVSIADDFAANGSMPSDEHDRRRVEVLALARAAIAAAEAK